MEPTLDFLRVDLGVQFYVGAVLIIGSLVGLWIWFRSDKTEVTFGTPDKAKKVTEDYLRAKRQATAQRNTVPTVKSKRHRKLDDELGGLLSAAAISDDAEDSRTLSSSAFSPSNYAAPSFSDSSSSSSSSSSSCSSSSYGGGGGGDGGGGGGGCD